VYRIAVAIVLAAGTARAEPLSDASLQALVARTVRVEVDDTRNVSGRLLAFDTMSLTIAASGTNEVVAVLRDHVRRVILLETEPEPETVRTWGLHFGVPGTLAGDVDYGRLHAFASANVVLPLLTATSDSTWFAAALGGGLSVHVSPGWRFDAFASVMPLHYTSFYTYLAAGLGVGFHHTAASGLSFGFALPVIGFAARLGKSPNGYDAPFRYADSLGYFYLAGISALPLVTVGYRF
jgi:hypothetical protein